MKIDKNRNLVIPIERENGEKIYVHSIPISNEVFETFHAVLSATLSSLTVNGLNIMSCVTTAKLALRDAASNLGMLDKVNSGFFSEIRRTSTLLYLTDNGWDTMVLDDAIKREVIDYDEISEVENAIVFFTLICRVFLKQHRPTLKKGMASLMDCAETSLSATEYTDSLQKSTHVTDTSGTTSLIVC